MDNKQLAMSGSGISQSLHGMSLANRRQTTRQTEQLACRALVANLNEQARAHLANTALQNVGTLTALEEHLIHISPLGAARYQAIVDAYTIGAAQAVTRW